MFEEYGITNMEQGANGTTIQFKDIESLANMVTDEEISELLMSLVSGEVPSHYILMLNLYNLNNVTSMMEAILANYGDFGPLEDLFREYDFEPETPKEAASLFMDLDMDSEGTALFEEIATEEANDIILEFLKGEFERFLTDLVEPKVRIDETIVIGNARNDFDILNQAYETILNGINRAFEDSQIRTKLLNFLNFVNGDIDWFAVADEFVRKYESLPERW